MKDQKQDKELWKKNIKKYDLQWPDENIIRYLNISYPKHEERNEIKVLDFGCGSGRNTAAIAQLGFATYAVDYNQECINKTREILENTMINIMEDSFRKNENTDIPFDNEVFDCILAWGSMFLNDSSARKNLLNEMNSKLKSGGFFYANWRAEDDFFMGKGEEIESNLYKLDNRAKVHGLEGMTYYFASREALEELYNECGFEIYNIEKRVFTIKNMTVNNSHWHVWARKI